MSKLSDHLKQQNNYYKTGFKNYVKPKPELTEKEKRYILLDGEIIGLRLDKIKVTYHIPQLNHEADNKFLSRLINQHEIAARRKQSMPTWLTLEERRLVLKRVKGFHVDHIIPVVHPDVCGLSVPWNLQLLTPRENLIKNNSFDGTYNNDGWKTNHKLL